MPEMSIAKLVAKIARIEVSNITSESWKARDANPPIMIPKTGRMPSNAFIARYLRAISVPCVSLSWAFTLSMNPQVSSK